MKNLIFGFVMALTGLFSHSAHAIEYFFANATHSASNNSSFRLSLPACKSDLKNVPVSQLHFRFTARTADYGMISVTFSDGSMMVSTIDYLGSSKATLKFNKKLCVREIRTSGFGNAKITYTGI